MFFPAAIRFLYVGDTEVGSQCVEVDRISIVVHNAIEIGSPLFNVVHFGHHARSLFSLRPHQNRIGDDRFVGAQLDAALVTDGQDGTDQVLVRAHATRDAVHDDSDSMFLHGISF